jgi:hypothetical protein
MKESAEKIRQAMLIARIAMSNQELWEEMSFLLGLSSAELGELDEFASNYIEESFLAMTAHGPDLGESVMWN